jgi:ABC-type branched-subunit amino acid transport system ATPase component
LDRAVTALEVADLTVAYDGRPAVRDVSFQVAAGEALAVIGPNGAGKTSVIDAITGFVPYRGRIIVAGESVDGRPPHERVARGLGRTFQAVELFSDFTVRDNVAVSPLSSEASVGSALRLTGLASIADRRAGSLPRATQSVVGLARALGSAPRVILLDEITAGLGSPARSELTNRIREVLSSGTALVVVDHDLAFVEELCGMAVVLVAGEVIARGAPADVCRDERVIGAYLSRARYDADRPR